LPNKVDIQWTNSDPSKQYCVGVYVFKKVSVASLIQHLKQNCVKEAEQTRKMVREKLQITDSDFLIETETLKVNLSCPLMKTRLQLPGRSFKCKHVQCFELESYLMMNEKKPTWNCPVCDQNAPFDDLIIDGLNQEILSKCTDVDEVEFLADGTWKKVNENDKCVAKKSKQEETKKLKINNNNDDDVEICGKLISILNKFFLK
jgi:E3 SUMO-protein ligase PIAS3